MANKIQVKRGLKADLPTLNVGEFAFCTDTKEVYLGSAEGNIRVDVTETERDAWNAKAPTSHASTATTYGEGDNSNYGHVLLVGKDTASTVTVNNTAAIGHTYLNIGNTALNLNEYRAVGEWTFYNVYLGLSKNFPIGLESGYNTFYLKVMRMFSNASFIQILYMRNTVRQWIRYSVGGTANTEPTSWSDWEEYALKQYVDESMASLSTALDAKATIQVKESIITSGIGWVRIASANVNNNGVTGMFNVKFSLPGYQSVFTIIASNNVGYDSDIIQLNSSSGMPYVTKARIIWNAAAYAYIEVYKNIVASGTITVELTNNMVTSGEGWNLITPIVGSIPSGYSNTEFDIQKGLVVPNGVANVLKSSDVQITEPTGTSTDVQVTSSKRLWTMIGAALSTLKTNTKNIVGAINELYDSLSGKQSTISGGATTITDSNLTVSKALVSDSSGKVAVSATTSTQLGYLSDVTSSIQTQLDAKASSTAQANVIESVKVNGTALTITGKAVEVSVPIVDTTLSTTSTNAIQNKAVLTALNSKVNTETGKGLSTNDFTTALKNNYDSAYTHSVSLHAPSNAERNLTIQKNGTPLVITNNAVNVTVPTNVSELSNDSGFVTSSHTHSDYLTPNSYVNVTQLRGPCATATGDWNNYQDSGFYMGSGLTNSPPAITGSHSWWYVLIMQHNTIPDGWILQVATDFNNRATYKRVKLSGAWQQWVLMLDTQNTHPISLVTGLQDALDGKAATHDHPYLSTAGGKLSGILRFDNNVGGILGTCADNDSWRVFGRTGGYSVPAGSGDGYLEIATADDGTEPIYVRQYTGDFINLTRTLTLLDEKGDTKVPGVLFNKHRDAECYRDGYIGSISTNTNVTNEKFDILLSSDIFDGWFEIEISSTFAYGSSTGKLAKRFATIGSSNMIHSKSSFYTATDTYISENIAISDVKWSSAKGFHVTIAKSKTYDGNQYNIFIRAMHGYYPLDLTKIKLSSIYTTDSTVYPKPVMQLSEGAQIWDGVNESSKQTIATQEWVKSILGI